MVRTASLEQKLIVIKHSVTAAGHAAARPLSPLPEPQPVSLGPAGRLPSHPGLPCSRPRPLSCCSARRRDRAARAAPDPGLSALQRREPSARQRPQAEPAELGRSRISPPVPVGPPARRPGCCHNRGFRLGPEARLPRPPKGPPPRDVREPPPWHRLPERYRNSSAGTRGSYGGAGCSSTVQVGGSLGLAASALLKASPWCFARGSDRPRRSSPRRAPQQLTVSHSPARLCAVRIPLSIVHPSAGEAGLPLLEPGRPGSVGSRPWCLGHRRRTQT